MFCENPYCRFKDAQVIAVVMPYFDGEPKLHPADHPYVRDLPIKERQIKTNRYAIESDGERLAYSFCDECLPLAEKAHRKINSIKRKSLPQFLTLWHSYGRDILPHFVGVEWLNKNNKK